MLRKTLRKLQATPMQGEAKFSFAGNTSAFINSAGGVPFYGNIYAGRVNTQSWAPPPMQGSGLLTPHQNHWDNPVVRAKIDKCPYFALCDQVLWHNMDPNYLDPGLLTVEEHQLLLLFSRAYFEKWRSIHVRPEATAPRIRIIYGHTAMLRQILKFLDVDEAVTKTLIKEFFCDDASLIGMNPRCWSTASLDPANLDHLSGRVLEFAGVSHEQRQKLYLLLDQMRRVVVRREDLIGTAKGLTSGSSSGSSSSTSEEEEVREEGASARNVFASSRPHIQRAARAESDAPVEVIPFHQISTLYDLYVRLGLEPYSGQIKAYDIVDEKGTKLALTINDEDSYFDFLVTSFYKADLERATLSDVADARDYTTRYTLTVMPQTRVEASLGRWF